MSDEGELLQRAAEGDGEAWREILRLHVPYTLGLVRGRLRRTGSHGIDAEDLLQEVWAALLANGGRNLAGIDPALGLRPYLAASVLRAARRHLSSSSSRRAREEARPRAPSSEAPDEPLLRTERAGEVETALASLQPRDRLLLRCIYFDGLSFATAARMAGVKESGLGSLLLRARERFREAFEREGERKKGAIGRPPGD